MGEIPHLPQAAQIDAYGNGGFRFGGMSHRGSILCLPSGVWALNVAHVADVDAAALAPLFDHAAEVKHLLVGTGRDMAAFPAALRGRLREAGIATEPMATGAAVRTYNILMGEGRQVAALLIAVE
jgi:uncharacterized protein